MSSATVEPGHGRNSLVSSGGPWSSWLSEVVYSGQQHRCVTARRLTLSEALGLVVRDARLNAGLSQERLAELAGLHRTYISELERGLTSISVRKLERLARALEMRPYAVVKAAEERQAVGRR